MNLSPWRKSAIGILSVAILNMGMVSTASAAIVDTATLVAPDRDADLGAVRARLARGDVQAQLAQMGVDATVVDQRVARLNDRELHQLAADLRNAPAGGDAVWIVGAVFIVLIVLELTGVIDIFKKR